MNKDKVLDILFFGRNNCSATKNLLLEMKSYGFKVTFIESSFRGEKFPIEINNWEGDYIICFRSLFILKSDLLNKARVASINFHPAPPEYPGSGCVNFALYDDASNYGVTAHLMDDKVDSGRILEVRRFPINKSDNVASLLKKSHSQLYNLCSDFLNNLAKQDKSFLSKKLDENIHEKWNGKARLLKELEELQEIDANITKSELDKIIRATYTKSHPPRLTIHGYKFFLNLDS